MVAARRSPPLLPALPVPPRSLPHRLRTMAAIASCLHVVDIEAQVRPLSNGDLMVRMQVPFAGVVSDTKLGEHSIRGRVAKVVEAAVNDDVRFPSAIYTPPLVPLKAENP